MPFVIMNVWEGIEPTQGTDRHGPRLRGRRKKIILHVIVPSLMPFAFASLRYGLGNGWKGLVLAEVFAATNGAGWTIRYWYDAHRATGVFGYALFFVLFALLVERFAFQALSRRAFRWRGDGPDPSLTATTRTERHMATIDVKTYTRRSAPAPTAVIALRDVNLEVDGHTFVSIVGPSGCGKSTLLNILAGIEHPTRAMSRSPRTIVRPSGLRLPVAAAAALADRDATTCVRAEDARRRGPSAVSALPGHGRAGDGHTSTPAELSGGMQQRVGIARAFASSRTCCSWTSRSATSTRSRPVAASRAVPDL